MHGPRLCVPCVCVCVADESRWMSTRTPSGGGVWRACGQSANQCVCVWKEPHKARHVCVCEVRRGICESVAGVAWRVRGERAHGTTAWVVGVVATALTHTHSPVWVAPQWAGVRGATTHTHAHTQRTGRGSAHSGGGWWERRTVVVAATPHTQPPPPRAHHPVCVCV